jgi:hypothetical protein
MGAVRTAVCHEAETNLIDAELDVFRGKVDHRGGRGAGLADEKARKEFFVVR